MTDTVFQAIAAVVASTFGCDAALVQPDTDSSDIGGWDSLSHVYLIMNVEEKLGIRMPLEETLTCGSVGELAQIASRQLSAPDADSKP